MKYICLLPILAIFMLLFPAHLEFWRLAVLGILLFLLAILNYIDGMDVPNCLCHEKWIEENPNTSDSTDFEANRVDKEPMSASYAPEGYVCPECQLKDEEDNGNN